MAKPNRPVVLIVDADERRRRELATALTEAGYAVLPARTLAEAIRMERSFRPLAAAVLDLDGPAVLAALREADRELPAIGYSGFPSATGPHLSASFPKPPHAAQLIDVLNQFARPLRPPAR